MISQCFLLSGEASDIDFKLSCIRGCSKCRQPELFVDNTKLKSVGLQTYNSLELGTREDEHLVRLQKKERDKKE